MSNHTKNHEKIKFNNDSYLCKDSPKDQKFDDLRKSTEKVSQFLFRLNEFEKWAQRMSDCSGLLRFAEVADTKTGEITLKLRHAQFCHVRHCPFCSSRRQMIYRSRFLDFIPKVIEEHPNYRWVFLTLTVPNVPVVDLKKSLKDMSSAWNRFILRKEFKQVVGWVRTTEVTQEKKRKGYAHPHYHVLMFVKPSFFAKYYVKQSKWAETWGDCMRLDVTPIVNVKAVKNGVEKALLETIKTFTYSVKPETLELDPEWTVEYFKQVQNMRFIASGGILKDAIKQLDKISDEDMIYTDGNEKPVNQELRKIAYTWRKNEYKYRRFKSGDIDKQPK